MIPSILCFDDFITWRLLHQCSFGVCFLLQFSTSAHISVDQSSLLGDFIADLSVQYDATRVPKPASVIGKADEFLVLPRRTVEYNGEDDEDDD